ncbi:MAG TPA: DUF72 domain-containing protein [Chthoniobacteraceae bacterium]|nr:DUF72 domain-containing protein [Chthoniobacteraceae bacterium]
MGAPEAKPILTREERRAKREARRARQREENVSRAAKMHMARLEWDEEAKEPDGTKSPLPQFNVGCSGWFYWHWKGDFYPAGLPTNRWFEHYARHFKTVELNAPFYAWPTTTAVRGWVRQTERRKFVFTVKVSELITHVRRFSRTKTLVQDFGHIADLLGPRMGCFLFQLPPSFQYSRARLDRILAQLDPLRRNVVEFRHRSWWKESVYAAFREAGAVFCSCSGPRLPDDLVKTADDVYLRFHGTKRWYRHDYTRDELMEWTKKIRAAQPVRVWAYFNNDRDGYAIKNARMLLRLLKA